MVEKAKQLRIEQEKIALKKKQEEEEEERKQKEKVIVFLVLWVTILSTLWWGQ